MTRAPNSCQQATEHVRQVETTPLLILRFLEEMAKEKDTKQPRIFQRVRAREMSFESDFNIFCATFLNRETPFKDVGVNFLSASSPRVKVTC